MSRPTISEQVFEDYLSRHAVGFERIPESDVREPDYKIHIGPQRVIVEVKEFNRRLGSYSNDVRRASLIREKIKAARRKFERYLEWECCLVLYEHLSGMLLQPEEVQRAMFGERIEAVGPRAYRFSGLAEMGPHHNTRISAVVALLPIGVGTGLAGSTGRASDNTNRRDPTPIGLSEAPRHACDFGCRETTLVRAAVIENPFARKPLSTHVFNGPFDERWARVDDGSFRLVFCGERVMELRSNLPP